MSTEGIHERLVEDWGKAGCPSAKEIQENCPGEISHVTASKYLNGQIKTLKSLLAMARFFGGDEEWYRVEWAKTHVPSMPPEELAGPVGDRSYKQLQRDVIALLSQILASSRRVERALSRSGNMQTELDIDS